MKKFLITVVLLKVTLLAAFLMFFVPTAELSLLDSGSSISPTPHSNVSINRATSDPYTGNLAIFEEPERENNLQISRVMDILKISSGKTVADIGAGSGWFTVRAAKRAGEKGKVYAVEINQGYIDHITTRAKTENLANIKTILGKPNDPLLPKQSVDAVLILKTYHEIAEPIRFMKNLRAGLRKTALVGIIDRNGDGADHGLDKEKVIEEAMLSGFKLKEEFDFVKADGMDYFLVFELK
ncbi:MAG: class I SAM-dependent methyltransferase [Saprospiraceae bacterium]|nr:class I SAM-dependent methyltransferase [Pyrinomonadaceae bacterium]